MKKNKYWWIGILIFFLGSAIGGLMAEQFLKQKEEKDKGIA